ncbi:hypothetical protein KPSA3_02132 [Pseudomonas syringae pv. actinidiae]|uniref:Uncharacterized protein n=1 Tax=Pseudomonas syringae pv. actinidiae TaxID=103796 RepID=A0AAN4Q2L2_PSESF|nr:hypothetical protein KPSA3_02132 [Pseudomonas syringae pv. actinidiae]
MYDALDLYLKVFDYRCLLGLRYFRYPSPLFQELIQFVLLELVLFEHSIPV